MTAAMQAAFDRMAAVLTYPGPDHAVAIEECRVALAPTSADAAALVARFREITSHKTLAELQELYTGTFDFDPARTLDLSWHVFGEGYERGAFLAAIRQDLRAAGLQETTELPDHVTHVLPLIGRLTEPRAGEFSAFAASALDRVREALRDSGNPYEFLIQAVICALRGTRPIPCEPHEGD